MGACPRGGIGNAEGTIVCVSFVPLCFIYLILFPVVFSVLWRARQGAVGDRGVGGATKFEEAKGWGETNTGGKLMARSRARPGTWGGGVRGGVIARGRQRRDGTNLFVYFFIFLITTLTVSSLSLVLINQYRIQPGERYGELISSGRGRSDQEHYFCVFVSLF